MDTTPGKEVSLGHMMQNCRVPVFPHIDMFKADLSVNGP